jgi:hypothetical protein
MAQTGRIGSCDRTAGRRRSAARRRDAWLYVSGVSKRVPQPRQTVSSGPTSAPHSMQDRLNSAPQEAHAVSFSSKAAAQAGHSACAQFAHAGAPAGTADWHAGQRAPF